MEIINKQGYTRFVSPFDREYINLDMSQNFIYTEPMKTKQTYWSPAFISPESNQPVVSVSIPYENGVMAGFISLEHLSRAAEKITHGKAIHITITDQTSSYIAHYKNTMVFQRGFDPNYARFRKAYEGKLISQIMDHEGQSMFVTAGMIPRTDWAIVFYQPAKEIFQPIRLFYLYMILGLIFLTSVTILLCLRHINLVISTLDKFTRSARVITRGNYEEKVEPVRYKEFARLADQFDSMADAVQTREIELKDKEEKYRSIFTAAQDAILLVDEKTGQIIDVNAFASELYQYPQAEFLGLRVQDIVTAPDKMEEAIASRQFWIQEASHKKKDGALFPVELSMSFHGQPDDQSICTILARDITRRMAQEKEKQQMQDLLGQAQKMEAIGRLAGGIAHDFNNILTAIVGFSELSRSKAPKDSPLVQYNNHVLKAAHRAKELVNQILTFARSSRTEKKPVQVNFILEEVVKFIRASIPASIEIKLKIKSEQWVMADPIQLHQVVMNLCTNSWHAMKENGGQLTLGLENLQADLSNTSGFFPAAATLCLTVKDTGHGITKEDIPKIFDPYFTTKGVGEGSGMGLSVVQGILRDMGGHIEVKSIKGQGSAFIILLPITQKPYGETKIIETGIQGGDETLLVVDDEKEITQVMAIILKDLGYTVETQNDPRKALERVQTHGKTMDLIISDMTMPGMNGQTLAKKILELYPKMPLIICTGFHETMTPEIAREMGIKDFLYKPVERTRLARSIRRALK